MNAMTASHRFLFEFCVFCYHAVERHALLIDMDRSGFIAFLMGHVTGGSILIVTADVWGIMFLVTLHLTRLHQLTTQHCPWRRNSGFTMVPLDLHLYRRSSMIAHRPYPQPFCLPGSSLEPYESSLEF